MRMRSKSCELDAIPTKILKDILDVIISAITQLLNRSLKTGIFAKEWKDKVIRPLLKKIRLDLVVSNYRPVTNLKFLIKSFGKVVLEQFNDHCKKYGLMPIYQSTYRKNFSCKTAICKLINDMLWNMENQNVTPIVATDLLAAFDTVDYDIKLSGLEMEFGLSNNRLRWFNSYL